MDSSNPGAGQSPASSALEARQRQQQQVLYELLDWMGDGEEEPESGAASSPLPGGPAPILPDAVIDHYLERSGFECSDVRLYVGGGGVGEGQAHVLPLRP